MRLRIIPGDIQLKTVKMLLENAYGVHVTVEYPAEAVTDGVVTINAPVTDICDAADLGNFPLHLVYFYITHSAVTTGQQYSLKIPGMELIYANVPQELLLRYR